jgi:hypothetical protein
MLNRFNRITGERLQMQDLKVDCPQDHAVSAIAWHERPAHR